MRANTAISRAICATLSSSFGRASHRHGPLDVAFVFVLYDFGPRDNLHRIFGPGRPGECMLSGRSSLEDAARVLDHLPSEGTHAKESIIEQTPRRTRPSNGSCHCGTEHAEARRVAHALKSPLQKTFSSPDTGNNAKCATPKFFAKDEIVKFEIWEDGRRFSSQSRRPSASSGVGRALS